MTKRLPPLNALRAFEAAARLGSVTRAAAELHVTHGAISHHIRALESSLRVTLFRREGGRLALSPHGSALLPAISAAFYGISNAVARVTGTAAEGDLVVSCTPALLSFWLLPNLPSFTEQYPGVRLRLIPSNETRDLHAADVDLFIRYGDGHWPGLWVRFLTGVSLFPICSPTLVNRRPLRDVQDLSGHVLLHADEGLEWNSWLAACNALHLARSRHHFLTDARLAIEAAVHGHGIALGDTITASQALSHGRLVVPFDITVPAVHAFYVVCRSEAKNQPLISVFIEWLFAAIAATVHRR